MKFLPIVRCVSGSTRWPDSLVFETIAHAAVDEAFYDHLKQFRWLSDPRGYPRRSAGRKLIYLHAEVAKLGGLLVSDEVDHNDHDPLNAQLTNLRPATHSQNQANKVKAKRTKSSRYKGVSFRARTSRWKVDVGGSFRGYFLNEKDAAQSADVAMIEQYGEFALTNKKLGLL